MRDKQSTHTSARPGFYCALLITSVTLGGCGSSISPSLTVGASEMRRSETSTPPRMSLSGRSSEASTRQVAASERSSEAPMPLSGGAIEQLKREINAEGVHPGLVDAASADGEYLCTGDYSEVAILWRLSTNGARQALWTLYGHESPILACTVSAKLGLVATGDWKGGLIVWRIASGQPVWKLKSNAQISALAFNLSGELMVGGQEGELMAWGLYSERWIELRSAVGEEMKVEGLAFNEEGLLAVASKDNIEVWERGEVIAHRDVERRAQHLRFTRDRLTGWCSGEDEEWQLTSNGRGATYLM